MRYDARNSEVLLLAPQAVTNGATVTANLDLSSGGPNANARAIAAEIVIDFAAQVNTNALSPTVQILESDDTVVTNFATIVANQNPVLTNKGAMRYLIDMGQPRKRYLRVSVGIPTATNDNQVVSVNGRVQFDSEPTKTADYMIAATGGGNDTNSTAVLVV